MFPISDIRLFSYSLLIILYYIILYDIAKNAKYEAYSSVYVYALHLVLHTYLIELFVIRFHSILGLLINRIVV